MELRPILSTLRRHKTAALLISLEIALTCAIVCNAVFLIGTRLHRIHMPSGIREQGLLRIQMAGISKDGAAARIEADLAALRRVPGVKSVAYTNQVPFGNSSWNSGIQLDPDQQQTTINATTYFGSGALLKTLGVKRVAGRGFHEDELVDFTSKTGPAALNGVHTVIITRWLANRLWPGKPALGKTIYLGHSGGLRVVGIIADLVRPSIWNDAIAHATMVFPVRSRLPGGNYLLRVDPSHAEAILKAAVAKLQQMDPNRVVTEQQTFSQIRAKFFEKDTSMAWLLVTVCVLLLVVTALGIVGLASFWVQQRTRQIGIRRALGATHRDILRYFQTENFLLTTFGILLGLLFSYGINLELMRHYELHRLPFGYFAAGAVLLWILGQAAVLGPALRASAVPPALATRSV